MNTNKEHLRFLKNQVASLQQNEENKINKKQKKWIRIKNGMKLINISKKN